MNIWQAILLGFVQGVAEFLPISSSGHLVLFQSLLGLPDTANYFVFDVLLHLGTMLSVLVFYWKDVLDLIKQFFMTIVDIFTKGKPNINKNATRRLVFMLLIATVPLGAGVILQKYIEEMFQSPLFVGMALLFTGILLFLMEFTVERNKTEKTATYKNAFLVGCFQLLAIFPGVSRSGMTIFGGVVNGFKKSFAVRFSFLMSLIAITGAGIFSVPDALSAGTLDMPIGTVIAGMASAFIAGIFAIKLLLEAVRKSKFIYFSYYCFIVGTITIITSIVIG